MSWIRLYHVAPGTCCAIAPASGTKSEVKHINVACYQSDQAVMVSPKVEAKLGTLMLGNFNIEQIPPLTAPGDFVIRVTWL